jgi:hypothetical protein
MIKSPWLRPFNIRAAERQRHPQFPCLSHLFD